MYGTQAPKEFNDYMSMFENDVKMYGTQATASEVGALPEFENDVKMYGTQAVSRICCCRHSLRMM